MSTPDFIQEIINDPTDGRFDTMLVYGDWLEERGQQVAEGWRIMGKWKRWPVDYGNGWFWALASRWDSDKFPQFLPRQIFKPNKKWTASISFSSIELALIKAAEGFASGIANGWRPTFKYEGKIELPPFKIEPLPPPADIEAAAKKAQEQITRQILSAHHVPRNILYGEKE